MAEKKQEDQFYLPPPKLGKWDGFKLFMWNSERREFMGRTGMSWAKVGLFYVIFYAALAAFFALMLVIFYQTLDNHTPKWTLSKSIIGSNPGVGFRPRPPESHIESTLIWFKSSGEHASMRYYEGAMNSFIEEYEKNTGTGEQVEQASLCGPESKDSDRDPDKYCRFDINRELKRKGADGSDVDLPCNRAAHWGYTDNSPCIALKMNRVFDWVPEPYDRTDPLVSKFDNNGNYSMVYLVCEGENPADKENIGTVEYFPRQGFPTMYFPYRNQNGYLSPLVFVKFTGIKQGVLINVECKAVAKNIEVKSAERQGAVHFELLID